MALVDRNEQPLEKIRQRLDRLGKHDRLSAVDAAILRVALEARNEVGHTVTDAITLDPQFIGWVIDGAE